MSQDSAAQGLALVQAGRLAEATQAFGRALRESPLALEPRLGLAHVLERTGDAWAAAAWLSDACRVAPQREDLWLELASLLARSGRDAELEPALALALSAQPESIALLQQQGQLLLRTRQYAKALATWRRLEERVRGDAGVALNLGFCLEQAQRVDEAIAYYRTALQRQPDLLEAHVDLAGILWRVGDFDGSLEHAQRAVALAPSHPFAVRILGTAHLNLNDVDEAERMLRRALELQPEFALAEIDLAFTLLLAGRFDEGWRMYERRWRDTERMKRPAFWDAAREWKGPLEQPPAGRRIAVYAEQGLGDVIQFVRYIELLQRDGANVCAVVQQELVTLLEHSFPGVPCMVPGRTLVADCHVALLDLPLHYASTLANIPARVPYLRAPQASVQAWASRMGPRDDRLRVGFAWCGSAAQVNNFNRSMRLSEMRPLIEHRRLASFSLQKASEAAFTDHLPAAGAWTDLTAQWSDFSDSAAMIENLDLVITVDTAIAHLAGALGKPVWVLLARNADWRYLLDRTDSPWYPTMRLFRLGQDETREAQVARVLAALDERLARS